MGPPEKICRAWQRYGLWVILTNLIVPKGRNMSQGAYQTTCPSWKEKYISLGPSGTTCSTNRNLNFGPSWTVCSTRQKHEHWTILNSFIQTEIQAWDYTTYLRHIYLFSTTATCLPMSVTVTNDSYLPPVSHETTVTYLHVSHNSCLSSSMAGTSRQCPVRQHLCSMTATCLKVSITVTSCQVDWA